MITVIERDGPDIMDCEVEGCPDLATKKVLVNNIEGYCLNLCDAHLRETVDVIMEHLNG